MSVQSVIHHLLVRWPRMHVTLNHCSLLYLDDESQLGSENFIPPHRHFESTATTQEPKLSFIISYLLIPGFSYTLSLYFLLNNHFPRYRRRKGARDGGLGIQPASRLDSGPMG